MTATPAGVRRIGFRAKFLACVMLIALLMLSVRIARAETIDLTVYINRLEQTSVLLRSAISSSQQRASRISEVLALWRGVDHVRVDENTTISVDMAWLVTPLEGTPSTEILTRLADRIDALNEECSRSPRCSVDQRQDAKDALAKLMQEPRFTYGPEGEEADIDWPKLPDLTWLFNLFQIAFLVAVIGGIVALVFFAIRVLRNRGRTKSDFDDANNDPTTSAEAVNRALGSENEGDYRSAIRYLYLSSLLLLDERNVMKYEPTLTNREHLQRISNRPHLSDALQPVVNTFDRVWYGFATVDTSAYAEFRRNVERLREVTPNE
jgi:hypothetical protein